jgi:uncharacterized protein YbjT (DUF2867 family)
MMDVQVNHSIHAIVTGATGMVGEGVLNECLHDSRVSSVLVINRKPCGIDHPKLKEIIHADFFDLSSIEGSLSGYDACFFCLGVSSVGMSRHEYFRLTYTLTMHVARTLSRLHGDMTFCYISGAGTDSGEKARLHWARVKGKTENELFRLPFKAVFAFRPAYIQPTPGLKRTQKAYKYISWMYPILRRVFPNSACTLKELGLAMIRVAVGGYDKKILEVKDIVAAARM